MRINMLGDENYRIKGVRCENKVAARLTARLSASEAAQSTFAEISYT